MKFQTLKASLVGAAALGLVAAAPAYAETAACLITKTDTNPFFVKMKEGATAKAEELGVSLLMRLMQHSPQTTSRLVS